MSFITTAAVVGIGATAYGAYNSYQATQNQRRAAETQVVGAEVAVRAAQVRVAAAESAMLGPEINIAAAEQKRIAALFSGEASARGYEFDAAIERRNSLIKSQDADYVRAVGEIEQTKAGLAGKAKMGAIRAAQGASNLDVNSGSAAQVQASQRDINIYEQKTIAANAGRAAFGLDSEAAMLMAQSAMSEISAANARKTGELAAKGAEFEKAGAQLAKRGAELSVEGARLGVEGARLGVPAAEFAVTGANYAGAGAIASGIGSISSRWMDANRVGVGTSGSTSGSTSWESNSYLQNQPENI